MPQKSPLERAFLLRMVLHCPTAHIVKRGSASGWGVVGTAALACHQPPKRFYPQPEQSSTAAPAAQQWTHPSKATPAPEASAPASK